MQILITGDFCPVRRLDAKVRTVDNVEAFFGGMVPLIEAADMAVTNLECPLTDEQAALAKTGPCLKGHPRTAALLKRVGFDLLTLANNHILDFGPKGLTDTLAVCRENDLATVGAGMSLAEAGEIYYRTIQGKTVAVINFCENEFSIADAERAGANPLDIIANTYAIRDARAKADIVLVVVHGGNEYSHYPSPETVKLYHYYADAGASAVLAHHTHCVGGYEIHNGVPIFYGLGNLLFDCVGAPASWYEGYAVLLELGENVEFSMVPYRQCHDDGLYIELLTGTGKQRFLEQMEHYANVIGDAALLEEEWAAFAQANRNLYLRHLSGRSRWAYGLARRLGVRDCADDKARLRILQNVLRCESHRHLCLKVLDMELR